MNNSYIIPKGELVSYAAAIEYENNLIPMLEAVNSTMKKLNSDENLIGNNPVSVMEENHLHHSKVMISVFKLNDYNLLKNTLNWVLSAYGARGFKDKYFRLEIEAWIKAIKEILDPHFSSEIIKIYEWMISILDSIKEENNKNIDPLKYPFGPDWEINKNKFFNLLIKGSSTEALEFSKTIVTDKESLENFYDRIVTYSMYEVGLLWQKGLISVSQEHLASSVVMKVMSYLYSNFVLIENTKGKAIITASVSQHHELGARMVSDVLELDGWDVKFVGANVSNDELIEIIKEVKPTFIGISVTLVLNIDNTKNLIAQIRSDPNLESIKILVGGNAFNFGIVEKEQIGADKISLTIYETLQTAKLWWKEENELKFK